MDGIMLLNIFVTMPVSIIFMSSYNKRAIRMVESAFKNINPNGFEDKKKEIDTIRIHIIATTWFIIISGIVLTIGFVTLFIVQYYSSYFPPYIEIFISSGIYIPIFLLIMGYIIKLTYKVYTSRSNNISLSSTEMKTITVLMAVILNITLIVLDWKLSLFVVAIILGKYIWIDFVFDEKPLTKQIAVITNILKSNEDIGVEILCVNYAKIFYPAFLAPTIIYQFFFKDISDMSLKVSYMVLVYISMISLYASSISGMDMKRY